MLYTYRQWMNELYLQIKRSRLYTYFLNGVVFYGVDYYAQDGNNYRYDGQHSGNYDYSDYARHQERYQHGYVDETGRYERYDTRLAHPLYHH